MTFPINDKDPTGRVPPGQRVTEKFPVLTAGTPKITPVTEWTLTLCVENAEMEQTQLGRWDYRAFADLPQTDVTCDIHCVTRWSKLDTRWRGVTIDDLLATVDWADPGSEPPIAYARAECDGDYAANLKLADLRGGQAFIATHYDGAPLPEAHGGPARLVVPKLYFWKSAKWIRRLILSPYDRKGFWEKLGYHNYGDPWREQRYRGLNDFEHRTTLDTELSRQIREERLGKRKD
ncbi:MAG: molybdopterin-dependent oxidoreductase [Pseudomonadota bacterium]